MATGKNKVELIDVSKLRQHPKNVRQSYDGIEELAASVKENGILQNLTVVPDPATEGYYLVVIGNRRLLAAREAKLKKAPCCVVDMSEGEQIATMLLENMQRRDLNLIEEAKGVQMTLDLGFDIDELSKKTGLSKRSLKDRKKIADMDLDYSEVSEETMKQITLADMEKLSQIRDEEARQEILKTVGSDDFTYNVTQQMNKEKYDAWKKCMTGLLKERGAEELFQGLRYDEYEKVDYYYERDREKTFPEFDEDHRYAFYFGSATMMYLYTIDKAMEAEPDAEVEDEDDDGVIGGTYDDAALEKRLAERDRKQKREQARKEEAQTLRDMRRNYMKSETEQKCLPYNRLLHWAAKCWVGSEDIDSELYAELLGKTEEEIEVYDFNAEDVAKDVEFDPANMIKLIFAALESRWHLNSLPCDWDGRYKDDFAAESWQTMYNFLDECGYKVSKREWAIVGGTSDLYEHEEEEDD